MRLEIINLEKNYGFKTALKETNITFEKNGIYGLLGPNGAGKSTLMKIICDIIKPSFGEILFENDNKKGRKELKKILGYLPQDFGLLDELSGYEFLEYLSVLKGIKKSVYKKRINDLLVYMNIFNVRNKPLISYSGGMKQRIGIIQSLLNNPKILILDEPTVGLDPSERNNFKNLLSEISSERIIILSTHIVSDIENIADDIIMMDEGSIIKEDNYSNFIKSIKGKIWKKQIKKEDEKERSIIEDNYIIIQEVNRGDFLEFRIISNNEVKDAEKISDITLEDAYFYYVKSKSKIFKFMRND